MYFKGKIALFMAMMLIMNSTSFAVTYYVDTPADNDPDTCIADEFVDDDNCTFRDAVSQVGDGDEIHMLEASLNIVNTGASYVFNANNVTFTGNDTTFDGNNTGVDGFVVQGDNMTINGNSNTSFVNGFDSGIVVEATADSTTINSVYVGMETDGSTPNGNSGNGIEVSGSNTTINTSTSSASGGHGLVLDTVSGTTTVDSSYFGTQHGGTVDHGNAGSGIYLQGNSIGDVNITNNTISGNTGSGVEFDAISAHAASWVLQSNSIGVDEWVSATLGNDEHGIYAPENVNSTLDIIIGSDSDGIGDWGEFNSIGGNGGDGVLLESCNSARIAGNFIGLDPMMGNTDLGNTGDALNLDCATLQVGSDLDGVSDDAEKNIISNNDRGLVIEGDSTLSADVYGNYFGTDVSGNSNTDFGPASGNTGDAIFVDNSGITTLNIGAPGVTNPEDGRNIFIDNGGDAIDIAGVSAAATVNVMSNFIGQENSDFAQPDLHPNTGSGLKIDLLAGQITNLLVGTNGDATDDADERNVFAGGTNAVEIGSGVVSAVIAGNVFGAIEDAVGEFNVTGGNQNGIYIDNTDSSITSLTIGGDIDVEGNIFASMVTTGIHLFDVVNASVTIQKNTFGLGEDGTTDLGSVAESLILASFNDLDFLDNTVVNSGNNALSVTGGVDLTVQGNYIGTSQDSPTPQGNSGNGIYVNAPTLTSFILGGSSTTAGNVIAASLGEGVRIESLASNLANVVVQGNFIGFCANLATGDIAPEINCRNGDDGFDARQGSYIFGGDHNLGALGDNFDIGLGNVIGQNLGYGVDLTNDVTSAEFYGNIIGLSRLASIDPFDQDAGNGFGGVNVSSVPLTLFTFGDVGGVVADSLANFVSGNGGNGLTVAASGANLTLTNNYFGTDYTGTVAIGNDGDGVEMSADVALTLGDGTVDGRNLISASGVCGLDISAGSYVDNLTVFGLASDLVTVFANVGGDICDTIPSSSGGRRVSVASDAEEEVVEEEVVEEDSEEVVVEEEVVEEEPEEEVVEEEVVEEDSEEVVEEEVVEEDPEEVVEEDPEEVVEEEVIEEEQKEELVENEDTVVEEESSNETYGPVYDYSYVPPVVEEEESVEEQVLGFVEEFDFTENEEDLYKKVDLEEDDVKEEVAEEVEKSIAKKVYGSSVPTVNGLYMEINPQTSFLFEPRFSEAKELQESLISKNVYVLTTFTDLDENGVADVLEWQMAAEDDVESMADYVFEGRGKLFGVAEKCAFETEGLRVTNLPKDCATVGRDLFIWVAGLEAEEEFSVVIVQKDKDELEVEQFFDSNVADENGKGVAELQFEDDGEYFIVVYKGEGKEREHYVTHVEVDKDLDEIVNDVEMNEAEVIKGFAKPGEVVFMTWQSVVMNSVVIADYSQGYFEARVPRGLPKNESHTFTVYSYNQDDAELSSLEFYVL